MTTIEQAEITSPRRLRRKTALLITLALVLGGLAVYLVKYGQCEARSKFCVVEIAGTRSEVGFEWDTPAFYISTAPSI